MGGVLAAATKPLEDFQRAADYLNSCSSHWVPSECTECRQTIGRELFVSMSQGMRDALKAGLAPEYWHNGYHIIVTGRI